MNNMKQRLTGKILSMLFLLFAIGWTVNSSAQGVSFSSGGDDNKTLIVKAWGDLTNYSSSQTNTVFTESASNGGSSNPVGIWYRPNPDNAVWYDKVSTGAIYNVNQTYYTCDASWKYTPIEDNTTFFKDHPEYLEEKTEVIGINTLITNALSADNCTSLKFVQDDGHSEAIKLSVDQMNYLMDPYVEVNNNKTYLFTDKKEALVDFSVITAPADLSGIKSTNTGKASVILPSFESDKAAKSFVDSKTDWAYNLYWLSKDSSILNVLVGNTNDLSSAARAKVDQTKTIVLYPVSPSSSYDASIVSNFDIAGVKNLVLHYMSNTSDFRPVLSPQPSTFDGFKNIDRVILPQSAGNDITKYNSNSSVKVYEMCNWVTNWKTSKKEFSGTQINILEPGALAAIADAHYTNDDIANGPCIDIFGAVNTADFTFISGINSKRINLSQMTFDPKDTNLDTEAEKKAAIDQISNPVLEYIALPDVGQETTDPLFKNLYANNHNLKGVAYYYQTGKSYTCKTLVPGSISILTAMTSSVTGGNVNIDSIKVSGSLNAKDISNTGNNAAGTIYFVDGHFVFGDELDASNQDGFRKFKTPQPEGAETEGAFSGSKGMIKVDLSDATFSNVDDATLSATDIIATRTTDVVIPTDVNFTNLPVDFLHVNGTNIKTICIPYNITHIGLRAFYGLTNLSKVTTTTEDGTVLDYGYDYQYQLQDVTNEETKTTYKDQVKTDNIDYSAGSIVFSKNLKEIDSYAFSSVEKIKDVYCLSEEAPICQVNAFGSNPCTGNNGFSPNGGITRSDFNTHADANGYIDKWIVMLHYPTSIQGTDLEKRYKDVTRDYTISDAEGHTDGQGNLLCWPNQSEFNRSYTQATNGYLWDAWKTDRTEWSNLGSYSLTHSSENTGYQVEQDKANEWYKECKNSDKQDAIFYHTGYEKNGTSVKDVDDGAWQKVTYSDPDKADKQLYDGDYRGWHQFVLCATTRAKDEDPGHNFRFINDNGWWTICVPFDMTKKEVCEMFGKGGKHGGPHVCEFTGVERTNPDADQKNGSILLKFDRDVYNNVYKQDADNKSTLEIDHKTGDDEIVIHAGVPYMLQPDFDVKDDGSLRTPFAPGDQIFRSEKCKAKTSLELRSLARDNFVDVLALDKDGKAAKDAKNNDYHYYFIGNFWQTEMPQYAYFLAWYYPTDEQVKEGFSPNGFATYFWQKEKPAQTLNWNAFTAIIGSQWSKDDRKFFVPDGKLGNIHWYTRKGNDVKGGSVFADDSFNTSTSAKRGNSPENVSFSFGGDNTADGITKVHFGDQTLDVYNGKVYNLNGQYVGDSLENLPKGIYIAGGKKYVVK